MKHTGSCLVLLAAFALSILPRSAGGALPPLIPRTVLFGNPESFDPKISPDGTLLAFLKPDSNDVLQVWVRTVGREDDRQITRDPKRGIWEYTWAWNNQDLLYLQDQGGDENFHVYAAHLESAETRDLTPIQGVRAELIAVEPDRPDHILVALNRRNRELNEPWLIDLRSGALTLVAENPGNFGDWLADARLDVRGVLAMTPEGGGELKVRDRVKAPWRTLASWPQGEAFQPIGFSGDGRTVFVKAELGMETQGLFAIETATGKRTLLASDPGTDATETQVHPRSRVVEAVAFDRDRRRWRVLDTSVAKDFAALAKLETGDFDVINRDLADRTWLVQLQSDIAPDRYYAWDRRAQRATFLFSAQPTLERHRLAPIKPVDIRARDGLTLPSYLTLPVGVPAKHLPMVLLVHGGPWARDHWGFNPEVQWLANRGYAVLQVNYRGSVGFGKSFAQQARKQFAGKMHDDLVDAVGWAVEQGIADRKRIGISGGSYGGYATLVGLTFTPDLFACGVDLVGPSNLVTLVESFPPYWGPYLSRRWYPYVGNPKDPKDRADMEARSPLFKVDRIKAPLLIGQGANDPRVKQAESDQIVAALRKRGKEVEYMVFADEGHGFERPENRLKFGAAVEAFLARHLGGRAESGADAKPAGARPSRMP